MHIFTPIFPLFTAFIPLLLTSAQAQFTCTWKIGDKTPFNYDFALFCRAVRQDEKGGFATYICDGHGTGEYDTRVASWSFMHKDKLLVEAPCTGQTWGETRFHKCYSKYWALCLGNSTDGDCFYHASIDDCEWPTNFTTEQAPGYVEVWYAYR